MSLGEAVRNRPGLNDMTGTCPPPPGTPIHKKGRFAFMHRGMGGEHIEIRLSSTA